MRDLERFSRGGWHRSAVSVPWTDLGALLPWLGDQPYLVDDEEHGPLREGLSGAGFLISEMEVERTTSEREYAGAVLSSLGAWEGREANWALFNDRMWDFYALGGGRIALIVKGVDVWFESNFRMALRCVHKSLEIINGLSPRGNSSQRQVVVFFLGDWPV